MKYSLFLLLLICSATKIQGQNILWENTVGGNNDDLLRSISHTLDGGSILGGYSHSDISGDKTENSLGLNDYWIVKLDSTGGIELAKYDRWK